MFDQPVFSESRQSVKQMYAQIRSQTARHQIGLINAVERVHLDSLDGRIDDFEGLNRLESIMARAGLNTFELKNLKHGLVAKKSTGSMFGQKLDLGSKAKSSSSGKSMFGQQVNFGKKVINNKETFGRKVFDSRPVFKSRPLFNSPKNSLGLVKETVRGTKLFKPMPLGGTKPNFKKAVHLFDTPSGLMLGGLGKAKKSLFNDKLKGLM